jgi:hypothetical protein
MPPVVAAAIPSPLAISRINAAHRDALALGLAA